MTARWKKYQLEKFKPPWWLKSGHAQTIYYAVYATKPEEYYRRVRFETPDNDFLDVDFVDGDPESPVVIALHGLEGGAKSGYILRLMDIVHQNNWNGVAFNHRGCSGEPNRLSRSYHVGEINDFDFIMEKVKEKFPTQPYFFVGYSLGANVLAKWLGTKGNDISENSKAAALCGGGYDVQAAIEHNDEGWNIFYEFCFLFTLRSKTFKKALRYPKEINFREILSAFSFRAFDEAYTAKVHGFKNALDYYKKSSSITILKNISIPTLLIHAMDDPIIPITALPKQDQINIDTTIIRTTKQGGHVGYYDKKHGLYWLERQLFRWFNLVCPDKDVCL